MPACDPLDRLRAARPAILPSLLLCDFANLEREIRELEAAGVPGFHLDVMDGHFVPNLTYGLPIVEAVRRCTRLPIDVHLMIANPEKYVDQFVEAGADVLTIHAEAAGDPAAVLGRIRQRGAAAGLAFNPPTPLSAIEEYLPACDLVLVMSVMPGFGGQAFEPIALEKLRRLRQMAQPEMTLEVDGGINPQTIRDCAEAGAELFVVGSAIFRTPDYADSFNKLRTLATPR